MTSHTVEIGKLGWMGQGVAIGPDQKILFIKDTYPGDVVEVEFDEAGKRYQDAVLKKIVKPSALRVESPCEYFKQCGACDYLDLSYAEQLNFKESILSFTLDKAKLRPHEKKSIIPADEIWNYRTRIQLRKKGNKVGFLKKKTNEVVDIKECKIAHPKLNAEIQILKEEPSTPALQKIELTLNEFGNVQKSFDRPHGFSGFTQIHAQQNEKLKQVVSDYVLKVSPPTNKVFELYCGDGNLTFSFVNSLSWYCGVDGNENAIQSAQGKLGLQEDKRFRTSNLEAVPFKIAKEYEGCYDTLVLDPPRQGIGSSLRFFIHEKVKKVIYVSCSPLTFIQDVQVLQKHFRFASLQPIDMFPHTKHLELVGLFVRS